MLRKTSIRRKMECRLSIRNRVVLVPFPFDDPTSAKVRPAVCLTDIIGPHQHVVLAFITSRIPDPPSETDIVLRPEDPDFAVTGLRVPSAIRLHRLMTVNAALIRRSSGVLPNRVAALVQDGLRKLFLEGP